MILERELTTFQSCSRLVHGIRTVPHNKIWFTATWSVQRLPFLRSDEWAWKVCIHRMCWSSKLQFWFVQRASSHQEISTSESYLHKAVGKMQDSHWYFEPSTQGFRKMLVVKWRLLSSALLAFLNIFRVVFEPAALYGLLPKIDCDFRYFKSWIFICVCLLPCEIGDSGLSILCCFQLEREYILCWN